MNELSTAEENYVQAELETKFREEIERVDDRFIEFVMDREGIEIAHMISMIFRGCLISGENAVRDICNDYIQSRLANCSEEREQVVEAMTAEHEE